MPGHVFVTQGDITRIACDAWLLPTSWRMGEGVREGWLKWLSPGLQQAVLAVPPVDYGGEERVRAIGGTFGEPPGQPRPWLVDVGAARRIMPPEWYIEGVRRFFQVAGSWLTRQASPNGKRAAFLVAVPVVGTGHGGGNKIKGDILIRLIAELHWQAAATGYDVALVTYDRTMFSAAQQARKTFDSRSPSRSPSPPTGNTPVPSSELSNGLRAGAESLAVHARAGRLVLFLGAGVSAPAGLPTWDGLLTELAREVHLQPAELEAFDDLDPLDRARILLGRLSRSGKDLRTLVAERLRAGNYGLLHSLLASLPVQEVVTTNYDTLFEHASEDAGRPAAVLPYEPDPQRDRWLLKLHGCVKHSEDIVLLREDYIGYAEHRGALAGIVQALLITRHMLFIGFSLADPNFHRIVHDVRQALHPASSGNRGDSFGTSLQLRAGGLLQELWQGDLNCLSMDTGGLSRDTGQLSRQLEIFIDYLLACASNNTGHVLDPAFGGLLTRDELALRDQLETFKRDMTGAARNAPAWQKIEATLAALGDLHANRS